MKPKVSQRVSDTVAKLPLTPVKFYMKLRSGGLRLPSSASTATSTKQIKRRVPRPPIFSLEQGQIEPQEEPVDLASCFADLLPKPEMMEVEDCSAGIENVFFENSDDEEFEIGHFPLRC
jgi:hypothetical protein